jgi:hypothetical protein
MSRSCRARHLRRLFATALRKPPSYIRDDLDLTVVMGPRSPRVASRERDGRLTTYQRLNAIVVVINF